MHDHQTVTQMATLWLEVTRILFFNIRREADTFLAFPIFPFAADIADIRRIIKNLRGGSTHFFLESAHYNTNMIEFL
jgi:hypothetical protein